MLETDQCCICGSKPPYGQCVSKDSCACLADKLHGMGDSAYCRACDLSKRELCLGEEHKIKTGTFTLDNLKALEEVRREFGRADGLWEASKICAGLGKCARGGGRRI